MHPRIEITDKKTWHSLKRELESRWLTLYLTRFRGNVGKVAKLGNLARQAVYDMAARNNIDIDSFRK